MRKDLFKVSAVSKKKATEGAWLQYPDPATGELTALWFRVASKAYNMKYYNRLRELTEPHLVNNASGEIPEAIHNDIIARCIAETILTGWKTVDEGKEEATILFNDEVLPFSVENAYKVLSNEDMQDFPLWLATETKKRSNFVPAASEVLKKN